MCCAVYCAALLLLCFHVAAAYSSCSSSYIQPNSTCWYVPLNSILIPFELLLLAGFKHWLICNQN